MSTEATISQAVRSSYYSLLQPWIVCLAAAGFFFYEFMQMAVFNAINPSLMQEFNISAAQAGELSAHYFYSIVLFLLPAGVILDRFPTKQIILLAMLICTSATYVFSQATTLWMADIARFMVGVGGAFALLSCVRLASRWFPAHRLALVIGLIITLAMVGAMMAQTPMTYLTLYFGWRQALVIDATAGLIIILLILIFVKNYPPDKKIVYQRAEKLSFAYTLKKILLNRQNWLAGIYTSAINLPIFLFGAIWGGMFLMQVHQFTSTQASYVTTALFLGMIIGSPLIGWLSDFCGRRKLPMIIGACLSLGVFMLIYYARTLGLIEAIVLFFALGLLISSQILSYPLIAESNPHALTGSAEGLASVLIMAGGFTQALFGFLMDLNWQHVYKDGIRWYSSTDYRTAMLIMFVGFIIGILAALLIRETYARNHEQ